MLLKNPEMDLGYVESWLEQFALVVERPLVEELRSLRAPSGE